MKQLFVGAALTVFVAASAAAQTRQPAEGWVVLSVAEYRALVDAGKPPARPPEPPPVAATISRIEYDLSVQADSAQGQARLTIDVFKDGWVSVPIPAGLRIRDARIDARPVTLVDEPDGKGRTAPSVMLSRPGRYVVALDLGVPLTTKAGTESLALPPASAPVQRVILSLRAPDLALTVTGGFVAERTAAAQSTRFLIVGRPGTPLSLGWGRLRDNGAAALPLRLRGSVTELVGLGEETAQVTAQVAAEVVQGQADRITLALAEGLVVNQVSGALVGDWEVRNRDLVVTLLEPVEKSASFTVSGESRTAREGRIAVPLLRLSGAERETGGVAIEVLGAGEITERTPRGFDPTDPSDLGSLVTARQSPALVAFRARSLAGSAPRSLDVTVARYTPQAVLLANIDEARYAALASEDGKILVEAAYAVRNTQRSFVAIKLPADSVLWTASVDEKPVRPGRTPEGGLLLPILGDSGSSDTPAAVCVVYLQRSRAWSDEGSAVITLPKVDLPVSRTEFALHYSPRFKLTLEPGTFRLEQATEPSGVLRQGGSRSSGHSPLERMQGKELKDLVVEYQRQNRAAAAAGTLPIQLEFPAIGPSLFLAAELTPEGKAPEVRFTFKREVK